MKRVIFLIAAYCSCSVYANTLPLLPAQHNQSPHNLFLVSANQSNDDFDVWNIDGGYSYTLFNDIDLYVGARINNSDDVQSNGFLSGMTYQVSERISVKSTLHSYRITDTELNETSTNIAAEISSRLQLSDNLDLHATLDYQEWQQGIEVGLGFRF
ncbi:ribonuclease regulator [Vibrio sp. 10N.286.49.B3]|uniref:ribonuclease regulator n=1 Tax=Vibrio sp. 10N.286.49.B3 TaxID=1880855 RepID=UPI000C81E470|nr:ribonuclease regulator [Vibrio sp. 10N.286.49.B3]PMH39762.1 ribonuclease regulator [Vibrio sp. 10N.286.49.B3]